ncbi:MAG: hypothetical protein ACO3F9_13070 [Burkholderiales bacterium]
MRMVYALLLMFVVSLASAGDTTTVATPATTPVAAAAVQGGEQSCLEAAARSSGAERMAQAGRCCAKNKGVCGCRAGKIVCCDKSFATGCTCNQEDPQLTL